MKEKARIAVIGAGWWAAQVYIPALAGRDDVEIVGISRRDPAALQRITDRFGGTGYTDWPAMLAATRPDGVVIASPHVLHYEHASASLAVGAHVLVDKPMTTSAADARALVAEAKRAGREIVVPYGWNFKPYTTRAHELVAAGAIGTVEHVVLQMASPLEDLFHGRGLLETKDHMFRPQASTWADPERAGGYGWGQLSHALGLLFRIVDLEPVSVAATAFRSTTGVDFHDAAVVRFASGATGALSGTGGVPKHRGYQLDLRLFGSEGMLLLDVERERLEVRRRDGRDTVVPMAEGDGAYRCEEPIVRLVQICLGTAKDNEATGHVGMRAVEVLDAMYRSFASGRAEAV